MQLPITAEYQAERLEFNLDLICLTGPGVAKDILLTVL